MLNKKQLQKKVSEMPCDEFSEGMEDLLRAADFLEEDDDLYKSIIKRVNELYSEFIDNAVEVQYAEITLKIETNKTKEQLKKEYPDAINIDIFKTFEA